MLKWELAFQHGTADGWWLKILKFRQRKKLFLFQMNERKPTWSCPVCDSKALYDALLIDGYFSEILESK